MAAGALPLPSVIRRGQPHSSVWRGCVRTVRPLWVPATVDVRARSPGPEIRRPRGTLIRSLTPPSSFLWAEDGSHQRRRQAPCPATRAGSTVFRRKLDRVAIEWADLPETSRAELDLVSMISRNAQAWETKRRCREEAGTADFSSWCAFGACRGRSNGPRPLPSRAPGPRMRSGDQSWFSDLSGDLPRRASCSSWAMMARDVSISAAMPE